MILSYIIAIVGLVLACIPAALICEADRSPWAYRQRDRLDACKAMFERAANYIDTNRVVNPPTQNEEML